MHLGDPGGGDRRVGPAVEGGTVAAEARVAVGEFASGGFVCGFVGVVRPGRGGEQRASIPITP
jgi:hypothetical protein